MKSHVPLCVPRTGLSGEHEDGRDRNPGPEELAPTGERHKFSNIMSDCKVELGRQQRKRQAGPEVKWSQKWAVAALSLGVRDLQGRRK